jgi:hypothetical protein
MSAPISEISDDTKIGQYGGIYWHGEKGVQITAGGEVPGTRSALSMDVNPLNGLSLSYDVPAITPTITLSATGIKLSAGPPVGGAEIELGPLGIKLTFAELMTVELGPTGIKMQAGATTGVELNALTGVTVNGVKIDLTGMMEVALTAAKITETAGMSYNVVAPMKSIV